jgi:hypothetical protein
MADQLIKRVLTVTFTLQNGQTFDASGDDTVKVSGLRAQAQIVRNGGYMPSTLSLRVYGLTLDVMNRITQLGPPIYYVGQQNTVIVEAGDTVNGMSTVFTGHSLGAWVDTANAPDVALVCTAMEAQYYRVAPASSVSYSGPVDVVTVLQNIATQMNYKLETNGVSVSLQSPCFNGPLLQQAFDAAQHANVNIDVDPTQQVIAIWPKWGSRATPNPPLISAATGMVGYPTGTTTGISVQSVFNPNIRAGMNIQVQSVLTPANGLWTAYAVSQDLASEMPDGPWFTRAECIRVGQPTPI